MRTCPSADGRWRVLTCHRQVIHYAPFKSFSIAGTKNKVSEVKGLDSRGGVPPLGRRRSKLSTGQFLCTASVQVLSINRPKKEIPERLLPIRKHREERENGIASAVPFSHFSIDAVTFDISKAPMPL